MRGDYSARVLAEDALARVIQNSFRILEELGIVVENDTLLTLLREFGASVDFGQSLARLPRSRVESFLDESAEEYDRQEGLEVSCLLPYRDRASYSNGLECTAGTYPQYYLSPEGEIVPHTTETVIKMTRLADYLGNMDRLGTMGVPGDVPAPLAPLYMRLIAWKHAQNKLSGCGEVHHKELIPYIVEMGRIFADYRSEPVSRYAFAEVEMVNPLKLARYEAEIFVEFWRRGLKCGIGFMHSAGGNSPVTLAGTLSLILADSIFVCILYRLCYGLRKLWFQCNASAMDMKSALFAFGRPERALLMLALGQIARRFKAGLWASAVYPDAKVPGPEAGMQSAFNTIPAILAGTTGIECFGLLSGGEIGSPVQLVIDNEYAAALKRFARGFDVNDETLAFDVIREGAREGIYMGAEHTLRHYRAEHWQPEIFTRESLNSWLASGKKVDVKVAEEICTEVFESYHPVGMDEETEGHIRAVIERASRDLL